MKKLVLNNFKVFHTFSIELSENENALIYGENGTGKTSIFEALKLFYFKNRILDEQIAPNVVGEERDNQVRQFLDEYKNDMAESLSVEIDDESFISHDNSNNNIFLVSYNNLDGNLDEISIENIIKTAYFSRIDENISWGELAEIVVEETNSVLKNLFWIDDVELQPINGTVCSIKNADNHVPKQANLTKFFNGGLLDVIRCVIFIESAVYFSDLYQRPVLVLDDCFNSMDMQNRTFMIRFLLQKTSKMQKIILTHNIGFFNLFNYIANNSEEKVSDEWNKFMLCKINGESTLITKDEDNVTTLRRSLNTDNAVETGNKLRRLFEVLIYKISRLTNIGEMQETRCLLDRLCSTTYVYLSADGDNIKNIYDLVNEIYANVKNRDGNEYQLAKRLREKIESFREHDFLKIIRPALEELRLMQKVALHQASHGTEGLPPISSKELNVALILLEKIEKAVNAVIDTSKRIDTSA